MKYSFKDVKQTITGAFLASLFFIVIRSGRPLAFSITAGIVITLFIIWLSNPKPLKSKLDVFAIDVLLTYIAVAVLNILFGLATLNMATFGLIGGTFPDWSVFGSSIAVSFWFGLPVAVLYNKHNIDNFLSKIFIQKR